MLKAISSLVCIVLLTNCSEPARPQFTEQKPRNEYNSEQPGFTTTDDYSWYENENNIHLGPKTKLDQFCNDVYKMDCGDAFEEYSLDLNEEIEERRLKPKDFLLGGNDHSNNTKHNEQI